MTEETVTCFARQDVSILVVYFSHADAGEVILMTKVKQEKTKEGKGTFHEHSPQTSLSQFGFVMTQITSDLPYL